MIWSRVKHSLGHRPWNLDIVSGLAVLAWGGFMLWKPAPIESRPAWDFYDAVNLEGYALGLIVIGSLQLSMALVNIQWGRWGMAFIAMWHWCMVAYGYHHNDPDAITVIPILALALANALILARLY